MRYKVKQHSASGRGHGRERSGRPSGMIIPLPVITWNVAIIPMITQKWP